MTKRSMTKRKILAIATLAAIPLFIGTSQAAPEPVAPYTESAVASQLTGRHASPQWMYVFGLDGGEALAFSVVTAIECSFLGPFGGFTCAVTGAL